MTRLLILLVATLISFPIHAVKLNSKGEKMVSEIIFKKTDWDRDAPWRYTFTFGYDGENEINQLRWRDTHGNSSVLERSSLGDISCVQYIDEKVNPNYYYTFVTDGDGRIVEMGVYCRDLDKGALSGTKYMYEYDVNEFDLFISFKDYFQSRKGRPMTEEEGGKCMAVKLENGNAIRYDKFKRFQDEKYFITYSDHPDSLNIDISQLFYGFNCVGVGGSVDVNYPSLVQWIPVRSKNLIDYSRDHKFSYISDNKGDINKVVVKSQYGAIVMYEIEIRYVE